MSRANTRKESAAPDMLAIMKAEREVVALYSSLQLQKISSVRETGGKGADGNPAGHPYQAMRSRALGCAGIAEQALSENDLRRAIPMIDAARRELSLLDGSCASINEALGCEPEVMDVIHINGDKLDNRRENLLIIGPEQKRRKR